MLDRLLHSHRQMEDSGRRLIALLDAPKPDLDTIASVRWDIGTRIMQHLALEDRHVYANLAADPRPHVAAKGREFQAIFARNMADYTHHAQHWTADRIASHWQEYRVAVREQIRLLGAHIALVERELYPLMQQDVDISEPGQPSRSWTSAAFAIKDSIGR